MNNLDIKIEKSSLLGLNSIKEVYIQMRLFKNESFKSSFVGAVRARAKRTILSRLYYESLNIISDDFENSDKCAIVSGFIRLILHFNLRDDNQVVKFLNDCDKLK